MKNCDYSEKANNTIAELKVKFLELSDKFTNQLTKLRDDFEELSANWPKAFNQLKKDTRLLEDNGWFILGQFTYANINELANIMRTKGIKKFNEKITSIFEQNNWKSLEDNLNKITTDSPTLAKIISDSLWAHREGKYTLVIIAGTAVIECMIADYTANLNTKNIKPSKQWNDAISSKYGNNNDEYIGWILCNSFHRFLEKLFKDSDFSKEAPESINRHWLMHRILKVSSKFGTKIESLRILLAIAFVGNSGKLIN